MAARLFLSRRSLKHRALIVALCCAASAASRLCAQSAATPAADEPAPYPTGTGTPLGQRIATLLAAPQVSRAHWGIAVTAMDGTPIYGLDEGKLFRPASTAKLFTTAAAMAQLGPQKTFATEVRGDLDVVSGTVGGDLLLVGAGDPSFATDDLPYQPPGHRDSAATPKPAKLRDLEDLADQLLARGIKQVRGDVVGDDTLFPDEPYPAGWAEEDLVWGYGAPVSALSVADNQLRMTVTPRRQVKAGEPLNAAVTLEQFGSDYYKVSETPRTAVTSLEGTGVGVSREPGTHVLHVYGSLTTTAAPDSEEIAIDDPAAFAAAALQKMLVARDIQVLGSARAKHDTANHPTLSFAADVRDITLERADLLGQPIVIDCPHSVPVGKVLATHTSRPVVDDVVYTAKVSENLHAEMLLHDLGASGPCGFGSTLRGARVVRAVASLAGIHSNDLLFYDGSGLSTKDVVTPRAEAQLLAYAAKQPWFAQWRAALPVGGVDGTLAGRFKDGPGVSPEVAKLKGHVFAKTGTLGESRALAGYLDTASGRTVIFSIMVDNHLPGTSADRDTMDEIVAAIAAEE